MLQRNEGGHKVETLAFGLEGFVWMEEQLQAQLDFLLEELRVRPTPDLAETIKNHRQQISKIQKHIQTLNKSGLATKTVTGCNETYAAHANAHSSVSTPGVRADADASFTNTCGFPGDTYAYAFAKANLNGTTSLTQTDLDTGATVSSFATASAAGTTECNSYAFASVTSVDLGINYSVSDESFDCQTQTGSGTSPSRSGCLVSDAPAATLLLPYFEVDLNSANGISTLFSVNNASNLAVLAHVVVWSDLSVPVLDFNIYLTGYDVQTMNLRDILAGNLPRTASAGQDPTDTISNKGTFSQDINFASCSGLLPPPPLPANFVQHLRQSLTGQASAFLGNRCAGRNLGDNIARGYITVDAVNNCTLRLPVEPGYFGPGGTGDVTNQNILWGDYSYVNPGQNFAQGETLVHIEADANNPEFSTPGSYTFYGRYVNWTAADNRKPLATNFAVRYTNGGDFTGGTDLVVWRDSKMKQQAFTCPAQVGRPSWFPLGQEGIVIFDEMENPDTSGEGLAPFPAEAQRTVVGGEDFPVPYDFGWFYLNLNTTVGSAGDNPPEDPSAAQAWVTVISESQGRFSTGFDAIQLDSACSANHSFPRE
ncbi:MAG TPA: hypothetical protein VF789_28765 [Thermoanaerobaculia bacterium]